MQLRIAVKLALLLLGVSLVPLLLFGLVSIRQVRRATERSVTEGNSNVSRRAAEEIGQYVRNAVTVLESAAENISNADLQAWQKERILKNHVNRFDEFNRLTIWDTEGHAAATSDIAPREMSERERKVFEDAKDGKVSLSQVFIKDDLTPAMDAGVPIRVLGAVNSVLVAELNLQHMWYLVDSIRIGEKGILHVLDPQERLIASGDGDRKRDVFQQRVFEPAGLLPEILKPAGKVFVNPSGVQVVAVGTRVAEPLLWSVIVEQPTSEAYVLARRIGVLLAVGMGFILLTALGLGALGGNRSVVKPILILTEATRELANGNLDYRVTLKTGDEFMELGEAFNQMASRLKETLEKLVVQERHAMFGRIASGLAHDLKHPVQAVENVSRLMDGMYDDPEFRQTFRRTVEREFAKINLFLANLHNLTHEIPLQPVPLCLTTLFKESLATFELLAAKQHILVKTDLPAQGAVKIEGDRHSLNRVFSNLISNALQAMPGGGVLTVSAQVEGSEASVRIQDTGMGIPKERMSSLFEDFVTTKRRGLGLGLAIVRKIVQQHSGTITVASQVGVGTTFTLKLPLKRQ